MKINNKYQVLSEKGFVDFSGMHKTHKKGLITLYTDKSKISCSYNHRILANFEWKKSSEIKVSDIIITELGFQRITKVVMAPHEERDFYDLLDVDCGNSYFTNNILSHNCEFLGSSGTLIAPWKLQSMTYISPIFEDEDGLRIYKAPQKGHSYIATVDTSEGLGQDYHTIVFFDVTQTPYEQVAVYRNAFLDPLLLPDVLLSMANKYNEAFVLAELNTMGHEVVNILYQDLEYENIMFVTMNGRNGQVLGGGSNGKIQLGLKSTKQSKRVSCSLVKTLIENDQLIINDFETYSEFTTFVRDKNTYNAEEGHHDDLVTCCRLFAWITGQRYFKEDMEVDMRTNINKKQLQRMEEMLTPFGILDDGVNYDQDNMDARINSHRDSFSGIFAEAHERYF